MFSVPVLASEVPGLSGEAAPLRAPQRLQLLRSTAQTLSSTAGQLQSLQLQFRHLHHPLRRTLTTFLDPVSASLVLRLLSEAAPLRAPLRLQLLRSTAQTLSSTAGQLQSLQLQFRLHHPLR
jgi:hypothetical protein